MTSWYIREAADDRHPDHAWQERMFGCAHTACGRRLPVDHTASSFDDPTGWRNSRAVTPSSIATQGASAYHSLTGIPEPASVDFSRPFRTPESVATVGRHYDSLPTYQPEAVPHFAAMQKEVNDQYHHMTHNLGINVQTVDHDPYPDVHHMVADVNNNKRLQVLGTHVTGGHPFFDDATNDKFRAVHDFYGHAGTGRGFDRHGEEAAFIKHAGMFTPQARPALAAETRGQNSSLILNGGFGPQKIATMDPRMLTAGRQDWTHDPDTDWYTHPSGHVIKPSDEKPGTHQLWTPTVSMSQSSGPLAKDRAPTSDLQKHFDWVDYTEGTGKTSPYSRRRSMSRRIVTAAEQVQMLSPWLREGVDTRHMPPDSHAYHQPPGEGRGEYNPWLNQHELSEDQERAHEGVGEDDASGYNWGPEPSFHRAADESGQPRKNRLSDEDMAKLMEEARGGGFTFRDRPGDGPTSGTTVSLPKSEGHEEKRPIGDLSPELEHDYTNRKWDVVHSHPEHGFGGWEQKPSKGYKSHDWYNDVSRNFDDPWDAAQYAVGGGQKGVYNLDGMYDPSGEAADAPTPVFLHDQIAKGGSRWTR